MGGGDAQVKQSEDVGPVCVGHVGEAFPGEGGERGEVGDALRFCGALGLPGEHVAFPGACGVQLGLQRRDGGPERGGVESGAQPIGERGRDGTFQGRGVPVQIGEPVVFDPKS